MLAARKIVGTMGGDLVKVCASRTSLPPNFLRDDQTDQCSAHTMQPRKEQWLGGVVWCLRRLFTDEDQKSSTSTSARIAVRRLLFTTEGREFVVAKVEIAPAVATTAVVAPAAPPATAALLSATAGSLNELVK